MTLQQEESLGVGIWIFRKGSLFTHPISQRHSVFLQDLQNRITLPLQVAVVSVKLPVSRVHRTWRPYHVCSLSHILYLYVNRECTSCWFASVSETGWLLRELGVWNAWSYLNFDGCLMIIDWYGWIRLGQGVNALNAWMQSNGPLSSAFVHVLSCRCLQIAAALQRGKSINTILTPQ